MGEAVMIQEPLRLNIGAGDTVIPGYVAIDRKFGSEAFPLPYPDNSVADIRASHILEHFNYEEVQTALTEWHRVLMPGGRLRISVPDVDKILATKNSNPRWRFNLFGGQMDANDVHKSGFDDGLLRLHLAKFGFVNAQPWESPNTATAADPCSLNIEAFKPGDVESVEDQSEMKMAKILAVTSIPRLGWNDQWGCIQDELYPLGIKLHRSNGAFWGQCIQRAFEQAHKQGVDWLLCVDFDTMFVAEHVKRLTDIFFARPDIDALAALQIRRQGDTPLLVPGKYHPPGPIKVGKGGEPFQVTTAHFGLTLIRMEALEDIPKPWFKSEPDKNGGWGEGRLDDDIWFWHQWRLNDRTLFVAPDVRVGHLELMVSDFDEDMQPRHTHVTPWLKMHGRAAENDQ